MWVRSARFALTGAGGGPWKRAATEFSVAGLVQWIRRDGAGYHLSSGAQGGPDGKQAPLQAGPPDAVQIPLSEL
jgi:hypothetical protein